LVVWHQRRNVFSRRWAKTPNLGIQPEDVERLDGAKARKSARQLAPDRAHEKVMDHRFCSFGRFGPESV
jgi:hypothetical protein